jgi:hypothetical protein
MYFERPSFIFVIAMITFKIISLHANEQKTPNDEQSGFAKRVYTQNSLAVVSCYRPNGRILYNRHIHCVRKPC